MTCGRKICRERRGVFIVQYEFFTRIPTQYARINEAKKIGVTKEWILPDFPCPEQ